jgi:mannose-1-phosphate guanylyltransferase/mannose-1-phosphate guanylyltransferase/mannose-6-phosphate isomerase
MIPVILSGGSGTRLWPVSRANYPKQFCDFYDRSFLSNSIDRLKDFGAPYIVTVKDMEPLTLRLAKDAGIPTENLVYEPMAKNTAAAVALVCHQLTSKGAGEEVIGIFPADHLISDVKAFHNAVNLGIEIAKKGEVVTLGIQPRFPSTGYGYIEVTKEVVAQEGALKGFVVEAFREKPDVKTAEKFVATGRHFWNAGIFLFKVNVMRDYFAKLMPALWKNISAIKPDFSNAKYQYALVESQSIDYGIMEKLSRQVCIPCTLGWSDVGSWDELARLTEEFPHLKTGTLAQVFNEESTGNYVFSIRPKVVGLVGVEDLIVVDTPDALLLARKGESQKVKNLVDQLKIAGLPEATEHPFESRPWGGFEVISDKPHYKAKQITVDSGQQMSYQSHTRRQEHWLIISGEAEVVLNDQIHKLKAGDSINIPVGAKHRIRNPGSEPLQFIEVQTGTYFGEDDITRYQDDYNRV